MLRKTLRNFLSQQLGLAVSFLDRFVLAGVLLRAWSTDVFADWTMIGALVGLFVVLDLGFCTYLGNRLQRAASLGETASYDRLIGMGVAVYAAISAAMLLVLATIAGAMRWAPILHQRAISDDQAVAVVIVLGVAQILHIAKSSVTQIFRSRGEFAIGSLVESGSALAVLVATIAAAWLGAGPLAVAITNAVAHLLLGWGTILAVVRRRHPDISLRPIVPSRRETGDAKRAMRWYALGTLLPNLWLQAPILVLGFLGISGTAVVTFVVHRTVVNFGRAFVAMLASSAGVEFADFVHRRARAEIQQGLAFVGQAAAIMGGSFAGAALVLADPLVELWTGKALPPDHATLLWLLVPAISVASAVPLHHLSNLGDMLRPLAISQLVQTALAIVLSLLLARPYGAAGVAFALAVGETIGLGLLLPALVTGVLGIEYWRRALGCLTTGIVAAVWAFAMAAGAARVIGTQTLAELMASGLACAVAIVPFAALQLLSREQFGRFSSEALAAVRRLGERRQG